MHCLSCEWKRKLDPLIAIDSSNDNARMKRLASRGDQLTGPFCWPPAVAAGAYCGWLMVSGAGDGECVLCVLLLREGSAVRSVWLASRALKVGLASFHQSMLRCSIPSHASFSFCIRIHVACLR
jgi:hypothetical protein